MTDQLTPRPYLSFSQLNTFEWSPEKYKQIYIYNQFQSSPQLELGKRLAIALEHREKDEAKWIKKIVNQMPDYPLREYKIDAEINDILITGILDGFDDRKSRIGEYKTGKKSNFAGWNTQMAFYALLFWLNNGNKLPREIKLYWAATKFNINGQLIFTGKVEEFNIEIKIKDILAITQRIVKAYKGIKELCQQEEYMFGPLPYQKH